MIQEQAILHFNKFKGFKNQYVRDTLKGITLKVLKVRLAKISEDDYEVKLLVISEVDNRSYEADSKYAHQNFKRVV